MDQPEIPHFMPGGLGGMKKMTQEEEASQVHKITSMINDMDSEVKDRFKALQAIAMQCKELDDEESKDIRDLEKVFENKYKEIYAQRAALINEQAQIDTELIAQFDNRAKSMKDDDYEKLEVQPCDVKTIQNCQGVTDFWQRTLLNHYQMGETITEKDRPILGYLQNIELDLHTEGNGYDLIFTFGSNNYFAETEIRKTLNMQDKGVLDNTSTSQITWKDGCNPTVKKQKKKKKGKKVTVETECESFFNIFKDLTAVEPTSEELIAKLAKAQKGPEEDDENDPAMEIQEKLADNLDLSEMMKDDIIPLALEYYLGVIEADKGEGDYDDEDDEGKDGKGSDDDEDGGSKKKKSKKGGKGGMPQLPPGADPKDCKQQ